MHKMLKGCLVLLLGSLAAVVMTPSRGLGQSLQEPSSDVTAALESFLKAELGLSSRDTTTRYVATWVDLNNDGEKEALVYLTGQWCGSGGCTLLVLRKAETSFRLITRVTIAQLPIRVLSDTSHGWKSIGVWVQGGGIRRGYEAKLSFDGKSYPNNPSIPPAQRMTRQEEGEIVISGDMVPKRLD